MSEYIVVDLNQSRRYVLAGPFASRDQAEQAASEWRGITRPLVIVDPASVRWEVDLVEACEPESLTKVDGITVTLDYDNHLSSGCPYATISGPTRQAVIDYARVNWGCEEDLEWFQEHIVARVRQLT